MIQFFVEDIDFDPQNLLVPTPDWLLEVVSQHNQSVQEINYIFCSDEYLLSINQQYLSHDYYTDIITFDNRDDINQSLEGDIFISIDRVRENAHQLSASFLSEFLRVIVHGILHLLGFKDSTDAEKLEMRSLENKFVNLYFQNFHLS
ncbi:rRNA maturation RNase YbeY [Tunicatimonas pelagia]|uniref:rRNA maturation RNase YbeY n=1 Tax=Tunicatimonas pelagia TaxID=931531 RepID=UPI0026656233|nr:rRNA maturation RNase YbeY [Tunicatimonas pelagia]WKN46099.1 rRNA maturation RNase YbeY [Tunicatimonas pelagia]